MRVLKTFRNQQFRQFILLLCSRSTSLLPTLAFASNPLTTSTLLTSLQMSAPTTDDYIPSKVWLYDAENGGEWAKINRPTAGARFDKELPVGNHPLQLYSLGTPNGQKVTILLEELLEAGVSQLEYDAWLINIGNGDQFGSGFVEINPNSKIPALVDHSVKTEDGKPLRIFESGSILLYLAEKYGGKFLPTDPILKVECMNWLFWQMGSGPYLGGGFGHFYSYAPTKQEYPINRFAMETKRQLDVLNRQLAANQYMVGDEYTIADMAIYPWYGLLCLGYLYGDAATFLNVEEDYPHVLRWAKELFERPGVERGRKVNRTWGKPSEQLHERHDASDFEFKTQDKLLEQQEKTKDEKKE
jgi:GST-like protein